jgi:hypothetical protein
MVLLSLILLRTFLYLSSLNLCLHIFCNFGKLRSYLKFYTFLMGLGFELRSLHLQSHTSSPEVMSLKLLLFYSPFSCFVDSSFITPVMTFLLCHTHSLFFCSLPASVWISYSDLYISGYI